MLRIAVDIGGTFTDLVAIHEESSKLFVLKVNSTPKTPEDAFICVIGRLLSENQIPPSEIDGIVHVGTIGSNLFLGQFGIAMPKTALVTTRGFRDIIEIGRQNRSELYNVCGLESLLTLDDLKLDLFTLGERLEAFPLNC